MWRWYTAEDRRQATSIAALLAAMIIPVGGLVLLTAAAITARLARGGPRFAEPAQWPDIISNILRHPADPGAALGADVSAVGYWLTVALVGAIAAVGYGWLAVQCYRLTAPTGTGFASRADVAHDLSPATCRNRAKVTRPDLTRWQRLRAPTEQTGVPLHRAPVTRTTLWLPLENATGVIAPQQSGKTLMDLIHKTLAAPGGLLVTSTKLDLFLLTATARERAGSTVHLLDLTGAAHWERRVRWNPIAGCTTVKTAKRRAQALAHAAATEGRSDGSNHAFFQRRAVDVLTAYLLAGALTGVAIDRFIGWCQNDLDTEAADALRDYPQFTAVRRTLQQAQSVVEETRSGIWETVRDAIACLTDPDVAANALPAWGHAGFDPETFFREHGTLYVIGSEDDAAAQAPLITAFVQEILDAARRLALADSRTAGRERLAPPFTAVLDEIASICPLPDLPSTLSDSAGRGVLIHYALQSPAQAQARWGKDAATLFDNTTALTFLGGLKSEETLKWASVLVGRRLHERRTRQSGHQQGLWSRQVGYERGDILEPAAIRQLPRGRALLIMRTMPALIVQLQPAWKRHDWKQLTQDANSLRQGRQDPLDDGSAAARLALTGTPTS